MSEIQPIPFGNRRIGPGEPVYVIAEIGINHEGDAGACLRMVQAAAAAGADAVKLQTIDADANYVRGTESHRLFHKAALDRDQTAEAFARARDLGTDCFTTAGDFATLAWVDELGPAGHKISSGLLTTHPIIKAAARTGRSLLMSTGMAALPEVDRALAVARAAGATGVGLFQCTSLYPAPPDTLHLAAIAGMAKRFAVPIGFSDHSKGIEAAPLAVAAGACMIEKHFSFDPQRPGFDHRISLDPDDFMRMTKRIREAEIMLGSRGDKILSDGQQAAAQRYSRCLVTAAPVTGGERFSPVNLTFKRPLPGHIGLPAADYEQVLGRTARRDLPAEAPVTAEDVLEPL